jgi:hypothetical protein
MPRQRKPKRKDRYSALVADAIVSLREQAQALNTLPEAQRTERKGRIYDRLQLILRVIGWPQISTYGEDVGRSCWLLVQQASHLPGLQAACLQKMLALPPGECYPCDGAMLEDRVRVNCGVPTLYGTQYTLDATGKIVPLPIEAPEGVEARRKRVGLPPLEVELRGLNSRRQSA